MRTQSRKRCFVAIASVLSLGLASVVAVPTMAASSANLVSNPSGTGGTTTGWALSYNGQNGSIKAVTKGGVSWLEYQSTLSEGGGVWVQYMLPTTTTGQTYTCGFEAEGSGTIYADAYNGTQDNQSPQVTLNASTPQILKITFTVANPSSAQIQVRYPSPPVDVYFNDVTCVAGSSVTLVAQSASSSSASSSGTSASSSGTSSSATTSSVSSSSSSSLPKTGGSPFVPLFGGALATAGLVLLRRRRRSSHG